MDNEAGQPVGGLRRGIHLEWFKDDADGENKYLLTNWGRPPEDLDEQAAAKWILDHGGPRSVYVTRDEIIQVLRDTLRIPGLENALEEAKIS